MNHLTIPNHIAIIMDGNGRWAKDRMLPKKIGHRQGMKAAEQVITNCNKLGVRYLTLYAFSLENWLRTNDEVNDLMTILRDYLHDHAKKIIENDTRIIFIGTKSLLPEDIRAKMLELEESSSSHSFNLIMAISYGSRDEIKNAALKMSQYIIQNQTKHIPHDLFEQFLNPLQIPEPDLLIRTGGEMRLSNFLLWQLAYSELYFVDKFWPDFNQQDLIDAIRNFNSRDRRYGR